MEIEAIFYDLPESLSSNCAHARETALFPLNRVASP